MRDASVNLGIEDGALAVVRSVRLHDLKLLDCGHRFDN